MSTRRLLVARLVPAAAAVVAAAVGSCQAGNGAATAIFLQNLRQELIRREQMTPVQEELAPKMRRLLDTMLREAKSAQPSLGDFYNPRIHLWAPFRSEYPAAMLKVTFHVRQYD